MYISTKSISDWQLLWLTGFCVADVQPTGDVSQYIDLELLATFCGVSVRTVRNWGHHGLPYRARVQLEHLYNGAFLPGAWRRAGVRLTRDGVMLYDGRTVPLDHVRLWPFLMQCVDYSKVAKALPAVSGLFQLTS